VTAILAKTEKDYFRYLKTASHFDGFIRRTTSQGRMKDFAMEEFSRVSMGGDTGVIPEVTSKIVTISFCTFGSFDNELLSHTPLTVFLQI
jgi:hypothetical protein